MQACNNLRIRMAQNHRAPTQHIVDIFVVVDIINTAAASAADKRRIRTYTAVGTNWTVYAAWHITFSLFKGLFRFTELEHGFSLLL